MRWGEGGIILCLRFSILLRPHNPTEAIGAMSTLRILHASDLHISTNKRMVSPVDMFSHLSATGNLSLATLSSLAMRALPGFLRKTTASSYDPDLLEFLAEFIYENAKKKLGDEDSLIEEVGPEKLDAVIITGDLATTGKAGDIGLVKEFLKGPFDPRYPHLNLNQEATLAAVKIPVWYFPGNHDRFTPTRGLVWIKRFPLPKFFEPGGTNYDGEFWDFRGEPARVLGEVSTPSAEGLPLHIVVLAADFNLEKFGDHEGLYGWLAQGKVYDHVLGPLVQKTEEEIAKHKESRAGALCLLWAVHFPPGFPHIGTSNRLIWEEGLISRAKECGVKAILAGHTHEQVRYTKPGMDFEVLCCGSTTQHVPILPLRNRSVAPEGNRFQIITVTAESAEYVRIGVENYRYRRAGVAGVSTPYFYEE